MNSLLAPALYAGHSGQVSADGESPRIWGKVLGGSPSPDGSVRRKKYGNDFDQFGTIAPGVSGAVGGAANGVAYYLDTATTACTATASATLRDTVVVATGATDNHEAWIGGGGTAVIHDATKLLAFESRFQLTSAITEMTAFVGLAASGSVATNFTVDDTEALKDANILGFHFRGTDTASLKFVHRKAGQAATYVDLGITGVSGTWYRLGFVIDPDASGSKRCLIYLDNEVVGTIASSVVGGSLFPTAAPMTWIAGTKNNSAAARSISVDWAFCGQ